MISGDSWKATKEQYAVCPPQPRLYDIGNISLGISTQHLYKEWNKLV